MENIGNSDFETNDLNLREQVDKYLRYWPWFIISVIILLILAFAYLRYTTPVYKTTATILIKDERNSALSELAAFQDLGLTGALSPSGFENEIQVLKSNSLTERVVRELDLNITYFSEGKIRESELYGELPFKVSVLTEDKDLNFPSNPFYVMPISSGKFQLWEDGSGNKQEYNFGEIVSLPVGDIQIISNLDSSTDFKERYSGPIKVKIRNIPATVASYRNNIQVEQLMKMSSVIQLGLNAPNIKKSEAILNEFIEQYNLDAINDRNLVARNTANFIEGRISIISEELDSVEVGKVEFKQSHRLTDLRAEGELVLQSEKEYDKLLMEVEVQLELVNSMINHVRSSGETDLLPANLGIERDGVSSAINAYNQVVLERSRLLGSSTDKNPAVVTLTNQIQELKINVLQGLTSAKNSLEIRRKDIVEQGSELGIRISSAPSKEKVFRSISRQQEIKETLYLYLLQKREENAISMAVTTPKAKVVDYAFSSLQPVSPKKNIILLASVIIGLLIPFSIIYIRDLLDNKVRGKSDIEQVTKNTPVIGEIPKVDKKEVELVQKNDRSVMAESFRILRTNLQYLFINSSSEENRGRLVLITSTTKGEGKTFVSFNLALTLAHSGAKVMLVGGDIRNPQLQRYTPGVPYNKGVVEFLVKENTTVDDYIESSGLHENLDIIFSGTIPPNPAELWMRNRTQELFEELRSRYDYVIVDTAPSMLVTDTFLLSKYADTTVYVTRAGYTPKRLLGFAKENIDSKKLTNVAFVLNNVNLENLGYGKRYGYYYGYGYSYGPTKKMSILDRLKNLF